MWISKCFPQSILKFILTLESLHRAIAYCNLISGPGGCVVFWYCFSYYTFTISSFSREITFISLLEEQAALKGNA